MFEEEGFIFFMDKKIGIITEIIVSFPEEFYEGKRGTTPSYVILEM